MVAFKVQKNNMHHLYHAPTKWIKPMFFRNKRWMHGWMVHFCLIEFPYKSTSLNLVPNAHVCVCIWRYILQNYNYKLHFQNLSIFHIPYVSIGTLAAENLDVCTTCDSWDNNIQLTMGKDRRQQIYVGFVAHSDIKILRVPPRGWTCLS